MKTTLKVARILFEVVGGLAIVLCVYLYYAFRGTVMKEPCTYSEAGQVVSADSKMIADKRVQTCSYGKWVQVRLATEGDEAMSYAKIMTLQDVDPARIELRWTGPKELQVSIPSSAKLLDAYGYFWDVTITRIVRN